jgi:tetratricopeptide (TPR) repeat protein
MAHSNLGNFLQSQGKHAEAEAACRKAIELQPDFALAHYNLGLALGRQKKLAAAEAAFRKAAALEADFAEAHCNLGSVLREQGRFSDSLESFKRGHDLGSKNPRWPYPSTLWVKTAERLVALERKLPSVLSGEVQPSDSGERIILADMCQRHRQLYVAAARLFASAFASQPGLASAQGGVNRYNAACAAALAGTGQGKDAADLDVKERQRWRKQALAWLRDDLALWTKQVESGSAQQRAEAERQLRHRQTDPDLAGLRDAAALAKLPEDERAAWQQFWADVAAVLKKAGPPVKSSK